MPTVPAVDTPTDPSARSQAAPDASAEAQDGAPSPEPAPAGFVADTMAELRRVVWPSRQQLFSESVAVILMVTLSAFAIAAIDRFYGWANAQVFR
ncbi:preprotein translocase subunit SecE [Vulcanococcus sp.]|uniref:preprotein translocase subunit SecE n=1 Tax=Vulcanococcus sp. TaxID=2856995 RepID=UPI0037D9F3FE